MDGSAETLITYQLQGDIALIALNRPEKRNAISDRVVEALNTAVERAQTEARAAVIHGHGTHFCAGLDLAEHMEKPLIAAVQGSRRWHRIFDGIERGAIPFVCAMQGAVVGGGFELAASAHIRVADSTAFFGLPEGQRGIFVGGGGSMRLPRLIGTSRMSDMMLTGRVFDADEGQAFGISNYRVEAGAGLERALALGQRIAGNAPLSNYAITQALPRIADLPASDGLFMESLISSIAQGDEAAKERVRAFLEKRAAKVGKP